MDNSMRKFLEKNKKKFVNTSTKEYKRNIPRAKTLPKAKPLNTKSSEIDQCFVILPDVHSYQRDKKAYDLCLAALPIINKQYPVTKVVQLGDLLEGGELSSHPVTNVYDQTPSYADELEWAVEEFWNPVLAAFPKANHYALLGNHEDWINKWLAKRLGACDLSQSMFDEYSPKNLYEDMGIHVTPYGNEDISEGVLELFPKLLCVHGWSFAMNAAKAHLDRVMGGNSLIFGHTHRTQSYVKRNPIGNESVGAWSFGALAKNNLLYQKGIPCDHTLGFGLVLTHNDSFQVLPIQINIRSNGGRKLMLPTGTVIQN